MSAFGTFRTWRDVRVESAMRFEADSTYLRHIKTIYPEVG
jgi:hypothetical protein